tara:strand:- start:501 stop:2345 length:1845 start_codon:yes stop_codon:yes gene_type:complete
MTTLTKHANLVAENRYYLKDTEGKVVENGDSLFKRVATAIASVEVTHYGGLPVQADLVAMDFEEIMSNLEFVPNSPTLMNAGTEQGTLSACFVLPIEDSMQGIMKAASDMAMVQKFGGGTGFALSKLRPKGTSIKTTHGIACGPIAVLKVLSGVSSMVTQGGKRDGANMAVMDITHPDIMEFIRCKSVEGDIHNFNISVSVTSNWMDAANKRLDYNLINPHTKEITGTLNAGEVLDEIITGAWRNGEPGLIFGDAVNEDNRVIEKYGSMIATNPCGEQPLLGNESCNLGSINLVKFVQPISFDDWEDRIDWRRLEHVTRLGVRFLDNVIDANEYATHGIEHMTKATRKIGLGVMGFADLLAKLKIGYDTQLGQEIGARLMSAIREWSDDESKSLAGIRGSFPAWEESDYDYPMRNACRTTVAPTGTISMLADCSSGIEPHFALAWRKQNILKEANGQPQTLTYINEIFKEDAITEGFYSDDLMTFLSEGGSLQDRHEVPSWAKEVYKTAPEISPEAHVSMQAIFQPHVDSGISKTINFANDATIEDVKTAYLQAYSSGCKGITVYRAGSREKEILVKGTSKQEEEFVCCDNPNIIYESGCHSCLTCDWSACEIA